MAIRQALSAVSISFDFDSCESYNIPNYWDIFGSFTHCITRSGSATIASPSHFRLHLQVFAKTFVIGALFPPWKVFPLFNFITKEVLGPKPFYTLLK